MGCREQAFAGEFETLAEKFEIARNPDWELGATQSSATGYIGLATIVLCAAAVVPLNYYKTLDGTVLWDLHKIFIALIVFFVMATVELAFFKVHRRNFDFSSARKLDWAARARIFHRMVGIVICLALLFPPFLLSEMWFGSFTVYYYLAVPVVLIICPLYFVMVEMHCKTKMLEDELILLSRTIFGLLGRALRIKKEPLHFSIEEKAHLVNLVRTLGIKGFFIPFMVISYVTFWGYWELHTGLLMGQHLPVSIGTPEFGHVAKLTFEALFDFSVLVDVSLALLGYLTSCRILDTQFVSAEPTLVGWAVALICYPPFNELFGNTGVKIAQFDLPESAYTTNPYFALILSFLMILSIAIYTWATVVFGLRFANLTNRGILCSGPYRWIRHPAYLGKNLGWWLIFIPLACAAPQNMLVGFFFLVLYTVIYVLRALTEERHLMRERHYQEYCEKVRWRFIPGVY